MTTTDDSKAAEEEEEAGNNIKTTATAATNNNDPEVEVDLWPKYMTRIQEFEKVVCNSQLPTTSNLIISEENAERFPPSVVKSHMKRCYPLLHGACLLLLQRFLCVKKTFGSSVERSLYKSMSVVGLMDRLATKRSVIFYLASDSYLMRNGIRGSGNWEMIGTDNEIAMETGEFPVLANYLSYDELMLSAMCGVSSPTHFINNGDRHNRGRTDYSQNSFYPKEGVYIGLVGARIEKSGVMEQSLMVIEKEHPQNPYQSQSQSQTQSKSQSQKNNDGKIVVNADEYGLLSDERIFFGNPSQTQTQTVNESKNKNKNNNNNQQSATATAMSIQQKLQNYKCLTNAEFVEVIQYYKQCEADGKNKHATIDALSFIYSEFYNRPVSNTYTRVNELYLSARNKSENNPNTSQQTQPQTQTQTPTKTQSQTASDIILDRYFSTANPYIAHQKYFDKLMFEQRIRISLELFLFDADARAALYKAEQSANNSNVDASARNGAYCHIVGLGTGVWAFNKSLQDEIIVRVTQSIVDECALPNIDCIYFSWFHNPSRYGARFRSIAEADPKDARLVNDQSTQFIYECVSAGVAQQAITFKFGRRAPADALEKPFEQCLLVGMYAWDSNALPGNEYFWGQLSASGDPAAACCSTIPYVQNSMINQEYINGDNTRVYFFDKANKQYSFERLGNLINAGKAETEYENGFCCESQVVDRGVQSIPYQSQSRL